MIIYNRDFTYPTKYTLDELVEVAEAVSTNRTLKQIKWLNAGLNIAATLITLAIFQFNLIALAISFVLTDVVLLGINHFVFIILPQRLAKTTDVNVIQKRIDKAYNEIDKTKERIKIFREKHCNDYPCFIQGVSCCDCYKPMKSDIRKLQKYIREESAWIDQETKRLTEQVEQQKQLQAQIEKPKLKDYSNKRERLVEHANSLKQYGSDYKIKFLDQVIASLNTLICTLDRKQVGFDMVGGSLYIYLDELQNIVSKWVDLDVIQRTRYESDIMKISKALSQNVDDLIDRIDRTETEGIEVGIAVLLKELTEQSGGEENV